jgi:hypothetical protein
MIVIAVNSYEIKKSVGASGTSNSISPSPVIALLSIIPDIPCKRLDYQLYLSP